MPNEGRSLRSNSSSLRASSISPQQNPSNISFGGSSLPAIDTWFGSQHATTSNRDNQESGISELKHIMLDVRSSMRNIETRLSGFENSMKEVSDSNVKLLESNKKWTNQYLILRKRLTVLEIKLKASKDRFERLEAQSR